MFDAQHGDSTAHPIRVTPLARLARDAGLGLASERSYMAPVLFWISSGQGRFSVEGDLRGYTANNAIFVPANLSHSIEISARCHGTAVFFADQGQLPFPDEMLHLRLHGVQAQTEMSGLIEDIRRDSESGSADRDLVLYHRSALMLLWLRRQAGKVHVPSTGVDDMLRSLARGSR